MRDQPEELQLTEEQMAAFAGPNSAAYVKYLRKSKEKGRRKVGFIWGAFLAPPVWLAYRKLYFYLGIYVAVVAALVVLLPSSATGAGTGISVAVAMIGKMLIMERAWKTCDKSYDMEMNEAQRLEYLARKGGVSWIAGGIVLFVFLSIFALALDALFAASQQGIRG